MNTAINVRGIRGVLRVALPILTGGLLLLLFTGCGTADLRSPTIRSQGIVDAAARQGRTLLESAARAHGMSAWQGFTNTQATMRDDWDNFMMSLFGMVPWDEEDEFDIRFQNNSYNARLSFLDGDRRGEVWGVQAWRTYKQMPGAELEFVHDSDVEFMLPTVLYFIELPFRILSAELLSYAGEGEFKGQSYDKVFATWQKAEPHSDNDQYIVWINKESGLIDLVEYTVREKFDFVRGTIYMDDKRTVKGITTAFLMTVTSDIEPDYKDSYLHQMRLSAIDYDAFDTSILYPDPALEYVGDAKPPQQK